MCPTKNVFKKGDALSPFLLNYSITSVQVKQDGLKSNATHEILVCADDINILG
jgi:hypothetical protein